MTPDVNVLVAASRSDHPHHKTAYACLTAAVAACTDGANLRLMPMVVASFLRLVTNAKIFVQPTPVEDAVGFLDALFIVPGVEMPSLGAEWPILRQLCVDRKLAVNDIPDAWLAAAVVALGEHLVTFDADFRKLLRRTQVTVLIPD
jgi:toxin-antitoxin system PIN domain toxin